jgi:fructoselysine 6-kinase
MKGGIEMTLKVLGLGDNVVDKYLHSQMMYPGGNALNFAVYAKQLGADSSFLGVFGSDMPAEHVRTTLKKIGVSLERCRNIDGENGYACIKLVNGDRVFIKSNKGGVLRNHPIIITEEDLEYIKKFDLVHTSLNSYIEPELKKIIKTKVPISFDFSVRGTDDYFKTVCPYVTYGFVSCSDLSEQEMTIKMEKLFSFGCKNVIATIGEKGAVFYNGQDKVVYKPQYVDPVDTLGAGDSFLTGFLLGMLSGIKENNTKDVSEIERKKNILFAMEQGNKLAVKTVQVSGAFGYGKEISE